MNRVNLIGRLTKDPELRFTPGTGMAVSTFTIAVDRRANKDGKKEADFIPIVVWGKQGENVANYMSKGSNQNRLNSQWQKSKNKKSRRMAGFF